MTAPKPNIYPPCPKLAGWLKKAKTDMRARLAFLARTSDAMYRQWVPGRRGVSADMAGRIEDATRQIKIENPAAPEPVLRGDLCEACRRCPYFNAVPKAAKGNGKSSPDNS